ncbi:kinase-like domain-containing protein, partial [Lyophyllum atratum]
RLSSRANMYPECYDLKDVELEREDPITSGGFADIYRGRFVAQAVCLKTVRTYKTSRVQLRIKRFSAEAILGPNEPLWSQLLHPNILELYGVCRYSAQDYLVSPWMEYGDIYSFLQRYPEADRTLLVSGIASAMAYLHTQEIVHGNLKSSNILVNGSRQACLADFGAAALDADILHWDHYDWPQASHTISTRWSAPELFDAELGPAYKSKASDIYAFSCVVYQIFTSRVPFFEVVPDPAVICKVLSGARPSRPPVSSLAWGPWGLTETMWSLMEKCWSGVPEARPTIQDITVLCRGLRTIDSSGGETLSCPQHVLGTL